MARVKRAVNAHKKRRVILERAKGYRGQRSRLYRKAKEQLLHSYVYSFNDRRKRKGDFRRLWIQRINAASRANGMTYNRMIQGLKAASVEVDRRMLAELAVSDSKAFAALVQIAQGALPADVNAPKARCCSSGCSGRQEGRCCKDHRCSQGRRRRRGSGRLRHQGQRPVQQVPRSGLDLVRPDGCRVLVRHR